MKVDQLFECHQVEQDRRVSLATLSFQGSTMYCWTSLVKNLRFQNNLPIQYWNELRSPLRKRHVPSCYDRELMAKHENFWWAMVWIM